MVPGVQCSVIALATPRAPLVQELKVAQNLVQGLIQEGEGSSTGVIKVPTCGQVY